MSKSEWMSIGIAFIALVVSTLTAIRQRLQLQASLEREERFHRENVELQKATSELAKKQLEMLQQQEKGKDKARLYLTLIKETRDFFFEVENIGEADATDVDIEFAALESPVIQSEYTDKFPMRRLPVGRSVRLRAMIYLSSPTTFNAKLRWKNPDGSVVHESAVTSL